LDIRQYIESGILEQYVLGKVSEKERLEVEQYAQQYPEIKAEIEAIEIALEEYALMHQVQPSAGGLDKIMERIDTPVKTVPTPTKSIINTSWWAIAATLLFLVTAIFAWMQYNQNTQYRAQVAEFDQRLNALIADRDLCNTQSRQLQTKLNIIRADGNKPVIMKGLDGLEAIATVHWNTEYGTSYLDVINLPTPATDKQYQLWAIIDGQPTDMGPLDRDLVADNFIEITHLENVEAFAVSEEPLGGSPSPTKVVMLGAI